MCNSINLFLQNNLKRTCGNCKHFDFTSDNYGNCLSNKVYDGHIKNYTETSLDRYALNDHIEKDLAKEIKQGIRMHKDFGCINIKKK